MKIEDDDIMKINYDRQGNKWMMAKNLGMAKGPGAYPKLEVQSDHVGVFTFVVQSPAGVTFDANTPFAPKAGKSNPADFADQFTVTGAGTNLLVVSDANANKTGGKYNGGVYNYELRFSDGSRLDPIITNNGCCRPFYQSEVFYYSVGLAAAIAIYFLFIRPMLRRNAG